MFLWVAKEGDQNCMGYKEICSLCKGNGYIKIMEGGNPFEGIDGEVEIKQCWLCESEGERKFTQAEVDEFIYEMYYKK